MNLIDYLTNSLLLAGAVCTAYVVVPSLFALARRSRAGADDAGTDGLLILSARTGLDETALEAYRELHFEEGLLRNICFWRQPNVCATSYVYEAYEFLGVTNRPRPETVTFALSSFRRGGWFSVAGDESDYIGLYPTRAALAVLKASIGTRCRDPLTREGALVAGLKPSQVAEIRDMARETLEEILAQEDLEGSNLIETNLCVWILYNLQEKATTFPRPAAGEAVAYLGEQEITGIVRYMDACIRFSSQGYRYTAYAVSPFSDDQCLTGCWLVAQVAGHLGCLDLFDPRLELCSSFVLACWSGSADGGFGTRPGAAPNLLHTYFALSLAEKMRWDLGAQLEHLTGSGAAISEFLGACKSDGGYGLAPGLRPDALATRLAPMIQKQLGSSAFSKDEKGGYESFYENDLLDSGSGAYRGIVAA